MPTHCCPPSQSELPFIEPNSERSQRACSPRRSSKYTTSSQTGCQSRDNRS
ncbi:hypothetical protein RSAG8_05356, partial [Rhizoctonia solani AG-8 WAC10335]